MRISNKEERRFYEIEAHKNNWSVRELQQQIDSALFTRLALSRDKEKVKEQALIRAYESIKKLKKFGIEI